MKHMVLSQRCFRVFQEVLRFFAYSCVWELCCLQLEFVGLQLELFCLELGSFVTYS